MKAVWGIRCLVFCRATNIGVGGRNCCSTVAWLDSTTAPILLVGAPFKSSHLPPHTSKFARLQYLLSNMKCCVDSDKKRFLRLNKIYAESSVFVGFFYQLTSQVLRLCFFHLLPLIALFSAVIGGLGS